MSLSWTKPMLVKASGLSSPVSETIGEYYTMPSPTRGRRSGSWWVALRHVSFNRDHSAAKCFYLADHFLHRR